MKKDKIKEKENKSLHHKILSNNNTNNLSKKRNSNNYNLSNRLKNIIPNHNDNSLLSKKFIRNIKKIIIKKPYVANDYSLKHKKITPVNYFQDYKKKNSSINKNLKKDFTNISNFKKIKNINQNIIKKRINKNKKNNLSSKNKRPYSKEEKSEFLIRIKDKPKVKKIKYKVLKLVAKKASLPEKILIRKINKSKNSHLSKSEIKRRRAKSNSKYKNDESQKIIIKNDGKIFDKINSNECNIDDILQNKKIIEGEEDNFDDIYAIIKILDFDNMKKKDTIFCIDNNEEYSNYKKKFDLIWKNQIIKK